MQAVVHGRRKREGLRSKGSKGQARWVWCGGDALSAVLAPGAATRLPAACRQLGQLPAGLPGHQAPSFITLAFSRMNFPSLYFWLSSYATSYFHPSTELQVMQ